MYIFLDESGDLGFTSAGSRYFVLTSVVMKRPFTLYDPLDSLRYDCLERHIDLESFHCANDNRILRGQVFDLIGTGLTGKPIDSLVVEKTMAGLTLQHEERFYPEMLGHLLQSVLNRAEVAKAREAIVITDTPPLRKRRQGMEGVIKTTLARMLPPGAHYRILHHKSGSHYGLQVADYCSWAIFRKYETGDTSAYEMIRPAIMSEIDVLEDVDRHNC